MTSQTTDKSTLFFQQLTQANGKENIKISA